MNHFRPVIIIFISLVITVFNFASVSAQQKGLLWQVTGRGIKQPTYLYGTIHLFDTTLYRVPQSVLAKLSETKQVYFELDFGKVNPMEMMSSIMITDSTQRLDKVLDTASLHKLQEVIKTSPMMQMLGNNAYRVKPIFLSAFLMNNGKAVAIDMEMYKRAQQLNDSVGGLETVAKQLHAIDAIPMATQVRMLKDMLQSYVSPDIAIRKITEIYVKQDIEHMMTAMNENLPIDADFNETLIVKRNLVMANRMVNLLGKQSIMIAVGSGHLGGKDGLIALLRKRGYTLKAVPFSFVKVVGN
ncbi:TraB/GumN family protein [Mucilaginibacter sp. Bleaf8]|uniref:TraB/GumN family protein n=1 Tax=Mucilaginibacter sp. Bleaf8 TaxID=2834430 RepID=UPI001BCC08F5|nr:TraB/GumN family protein [Mucilaginibacter sp. Bleaf8]MBS7563468.1 TraB/GumN family protein [Mucilaginibacter sp. Bleaf8]